MNLANYMLIVISQVLKNRHYKRDSIHLLDFIVELCSILENFDNEAKDHL